MSKLVVVILAFVLIIAGCAQKENSGEESQAAATTEQDLMQKADPVGSYGKGVTQTEVVAISTILAAPEKYEGKQVLVSGTVIEVCPKRGCWIELAGDKEFQKMRVKVTDGEIVFPLSAKGSTALVEGTVERLEYTKEQAIKYQAHEAEERGEAFDSTTVTGPMTIWRLKGIGAEIKG